MCDPDVVGGGAKRNPKWKKLMWKLFEKGHPVKVDEEMKDMSPSEKEISRTPLTTSRDTSLCFRWETGDLCLRLRSCLRRLFHFIVDIFSNSKLYYKNVRFSFENARTVAEYFQRRFSISGP